MAANTFGEIFRVTTFGESHGVALGGIIDGCPAGLEIDLAFILHDDYVSITACGDVGFLLPVLRSILLWFLVEPLYVAGFPVIDADYTLM